MTSVLLQVAWCFAAAGFVTFVAVCALLTRWHKREAADQAATDEMLERTKPHVGDQYIWDA